MKKNALYDKSWNTFLGQQAYLLHDIALWKELSEQDIYCYIVYILSLLIQEFSLKEFIGLRYDGAILLQRIYP